MRADRRKSYDFAISVGLRKTTHGQSKSPIYGAWCRMLGRVRPSHPQRAEYYDRGIRVCDRWRSFENFFSDMAPMPSGASLDRIDNDRGYEPGNCRWASPKQQARNRRSNTLLVCGGRKATVAEWSEDVGLSQATIVKRLGRGWTVEAALLTASRERNAS